MKLRMTVGDRKRYEFQPPATDTLFGKTRLHVRIWNADVVQLEQEGQGGSGNVVAMAPGKTSIDLEWCSRDGKLLRADEISVVVLEPEAA
jgi:hypothetical protein